MHRLIADFMERQQATGASGDRALTASLLTAWGLCFATQKVEEQGSGLGVVGLEMRELEAQRSG